MNYYYDVLLNFEDDYYMFYEWNEQDDIMYAKKIPLFHVDSKTICQLFENKVEVSKEFLNQIDSKTKLKKNKILKYACIFNDEKNSLAIMFDDEGKSISKSSLMVEDELNINEFIYSINKSNLDFKIINKEKFNKETRENLKIKKILQLEINSMYNKKNYSKLKYIYIEWFGELLEDIELMYKKMLNKLNEGLTDREYHIYELIKISYHNV